MVNTSFLTSLYLFKEEFAEKLSDEFISLKKNLQKN